MSKRFIRETAALFVACHHKKPNFDTAIVWAKDLSGRLDALGYGATSASGRESKARASVDYYAKLDDDQKLVFDDFWVNRFRLKDGKQRAVMVFLKHWKAIDKEREQFLAGAAIEAKLRSKRDTTPPQAEKGINEFRWRDHAIPQKQVVDNKQAEKAAEIREIKANLAHFKKLQEKDDSDLMQKTIEGLETKLRKVMDE